MTEHTDPRPEQDDLDKRRDVYHVERDGEELRVYNWANIQSHHQIRVHSTERTRVFVNAGDATFAPDAVTSWLADQLRDAHSVDVTNHDIEVVDLSNPEVHIL